MRKKIWELLFQQTGWLPATSKNAGPWLALRDENMKTIGISQAKTSPGNEMFTATEKYFNPETGLIHVARASLLRWRGASPVMTSSQPSAFRPILFAVFFRRLDFSGVIQSLER
jgi:hypothetical protein